MDLWCFVGGSTALYPHRCRCRIRENFPDASKFGSPQRFIRKDVDTSNTEALTVPWRSLGLRVDPNVFPCTDAENDDNRIVFFTCGILSRNLFVMPVCVRNVHHFS